MRQKTKTKKRIQLIWNNEWIFDVEILNFDETKTEFAF